MKLDLYEEKGYSKEKDVAQYNLQGRTHYVDDDSLRFHHARILNTRVLFNGLMFAVLESCAADYNNTKRGFRYVLFDIAGNVVYRENLENLFRTGEKASKALSEHIKTINPEAVTREAIERAKQSFERDMTRYLERINNVLAEGK